MVAVKYDAGVTSQVQTPPLYSAFLSFNKTLSLVSDAVECVGCYLDELQMHLCVTSMHTCSACTYERGIQHLSLVVCLMLRISCILCSSLSFKCRRKGLCCIMHICTMAKCVQLHECEIESNPLERCMRAYIIFPIHLDASRRAHSIFNPTGGCGTRFCR